MIINFYNILDIDLIIEKEDVMCHVYSKAIVNVPYGTYLIKIYKKCIFLDAFVVNYTCETNEFNYCYNNNRNISNNKKFILTDYYYPNLKIERGLINLWHTI